MKKIHLFYMLSLIIGLGIWSGCGSSSKQKSNKTGIPYATQDGKNKQYGGFTVAKNFKNGPGPDLVAIEGGVLVVGGSAVEVPGIEPNLYNYKREVTVQSFYMDQTEVSNTNWLEYLYWIRTNFPEDYRYYYEELPDSLVWRRELSYNEPLVNNYFRHPAYADYPVVGVSWEQANRYCAWRTDRVNEHILRSKNLMSGYAANSGTAAGQNTATRPSTPFNTDAYLNGQYDDKGSKALKDFSGNQGTAGTTAATRNVRMEDGYLMQPYRLPTEAEWEYAALAIVGNSKDENTYTQKVYPWNGLGVSSAKRKTRGLIMANFKRSGGDYMGVAGSLNDKGAVTMTVYAYQPNDFGLYNMAGNVNEWVFDVFRTNNFLITETLNPVRGNVFENNRMVDAKSGKIELDAHGRPVKTYALSGRKQSWEELQASNQRADSIAKSTDPMTAATAYQADARGYRDPQHLDLNNEGVTLINDRSRVYKGGSWNDMAYWLNPATRRFMQQDESSAEVGFRCAMTMLGSSELKPNKGRKFSNNYKGR